MTDSDRLLRDGDVPLNLRIQRTSCRAPRFPSRQTVQRIGWFVPGAALLAVLTARHRSLVPAGVALTAAGAAALAAILVTKRRQVARDAVIDERIAQSFPASDAPAY